VLFILAFDVSRFSENFLKKVGFFAIFGTEKTASESAFLADLLQRVFFRKFSKVWATFAPRMWSFSARSDGVACRWWAPQAPGAVAARTGARRAPVCYRLFSLKSLPCRGGGYRRFFQSAAFCLWRTYALQAVDKSK
jgi:hypothetical protein